ncbi:MAG: tRNA 2-thiouridine(34) synthase MnmA [bacterium]|nr:tRNA 2-thiouridine(34) synthase MnmA [bacterium]
MPTMSGKKMRIAVAMSGGVDSSLAAALLVRRGFAVVGIFMKNFSSEGWAGVVVKDCPWEQDQRDAQAVCRKLHIPFSSVNFEREYERKVIRYFFREYRAGRTPNPDVLCNREIKFDLFWRQAKKMGCAMMATGHYARTKRGRLYRGLDPRKDQSYFLYALTAAQLERTLFPLGAMIKADVRAVARRFKLPTADKKDSQGICFVGQVNLRDFLQQRIRPRTGLVKDTEGNVVGRHPGVWYYTIGQRHGLGIGGGTPLYVAKKDVRTNTLVVAAGRRHPALYRQRVAVESVHWINEQPKLPARCSAKLRYQQPAQRCRVMRASRGLTLVFDRPQFAVTAGQSAVLYAGSKVLGGGTIVT